MNSIRKRLLLSILSILTLATLAVGIAAYLGIQHEMNELYDANMRQLARMASGMVADKETPNSASTFSNDWPHGEQIFLIQIWKGGKLTYSSHPISEFPLQENAGFGRVFFSDKKWSYYQEKIEGETVQVAQELEERSDVIREVYNAVIIPTLIQFPIVFVLVWLIVSYGMRPLTRISDLIQKRTAAYMQPIPLKDAPDEIRSLVTALNDLLARLENSFETQKRFTADAAHELRTPLTAVRLQLDLLRRSKDGDSKSGGEWQDSLSTLEKGVARSTHLVQQLLELARQEPGQRKDQNETTDLADITRTVSEEHQPLARAKSISLKTDAQSLKIYADGSALSILIGNLISNAIAYTENGGNVLVQVSLEDGKPVISVADNGIGIGEKDRNRIFDRFYRVVGTSTAGSGLGLSIVRAIAEKHGAEIVVSNGIDGKGTSFRIILPALSLA